MSTWKAFNDYEKQDFVRRNKDVLRDEINNIALQLAKSRETPKNKRVSIMP